MSYTGNSTAGLDGGAGIPDDGPDGYCMACHGRGGKISTQDPVGDGVGSETLFDPCPSCLGDGKCPLCGGPVDAEYACSTEGCAWTSELTYEPYEDWGDWDDSDCWGEIISYEDLPL